MMASRAGELQAMMMQARAREACRGGARREGWLLSHCLSKVRPHNTLHGLPCPFCRWRARQKNGAITGGHSGGRDGGGSVGSDSVYGGGQAVAVATWSRRRRQRLRLLIEVEAAGEGASYTPLWAPSVSLWRPRPPRQWYTYSRIPRDSQRGHQFSTCLYRWHSSDEYLRVSSGRPHGLSPMTIGGHR